MTHRLSPLKWLIFIERKNQLLKNLKNSSDFQLKSLLWAHGPENRSPADWTGDEVVRGTLTKNWISLWRILDRKLSEDFHIYGNMKWNILPAKEIIVWKILLWNVFNYKTYFRCESKKCFIIEFSTDWQCFIIGFYDRKLLSQANCFICGPPLLLSVNCPRIPWQELKDSKLFEF